MQFTQWPKTPRLFNSDITVTEKIDGVYAGVLIEEHPYGSYFRDRPPAGTVIAVVPGSFIEQTEFWVGAQSRSRMINPVDDNYDFASWVMGNADLLVHDLGVGVHSGEWWGQGIRRGYNRSDRSFSLFNTRKWGSRLFLTPGLDAVPVLYEGSFDQAEIEEAAYYLESGGSVAEPGFDRPEGVCVYHRRADTVLKYTFDGDGHKG